MIWIAHLLCLPELSELMNFQVSLLGKTLFSLSSEMWLVSCRRSLVVPCKLCSLLPSCFASPEDHLLAMQLFREKKSGVSLMVYFRDNSWIRKTSLLWRLITCQSCTLPALSLVNPQPLQVWSICYCFIWVKVFKFAFKECSTGF